MVTDEMLDAIDRLFALCPHDDIARGIQIVRDMLCDYDDDYYYMMSDEQRDAWVKSHY